MTNEADSPERIEREIEHDRDALRRTLTDLQGELSLDGFTRRVSDQLRDHGGEWANSAAHAARANPVALALTGVGLAWLIFGRGYDPTHQSRALSSGSRGGDDWRRPERPYPVRRSGGSISELWQHVLVAGDLDNQRQRPRPRAWRRLGPAARHGRQDRQQGP